MRFVNDQLSCTLYQRKPCGPFLISNPVRVEVLVLWRLMQCFWIYVVGFQDEVCCLVEERSLVFVYERSSWLNSEKEFVVWVKCYTCSAPLRPRSAPLRAALACHAPLRSARAERRGARFALRAFADPAFLVGIAQLWSPFAQVL